MASLPKSFMCVLWAAEQLQIWQHPQNMREVKAFPKCNGDRLFSTGCAFQWAGEAHAIYQGESSLEEKARQWNTESKNWECSTNRSAQA